MTMPSLSIFFLAGLSAAGLVAAMTAGVPAGQVVEVRSFHR